jgi:hypothetical protein
MQTHSVKHLAQTHCRISVTRSDTSLHQLIVIYLTVFSQSASPLCQHEEVRLVLYMQVTGGAHATDCQIQAMTSNAFAQ